jgi:hypothetical protein
MADFGRFAFESMATEKQVEHEKQMRQRLKVEAVGISELCVFRTDELRVAYLVREV